MSWVDTVRSIGPDGPHAFYRFQETANLAILSEVGPDGYHNNAPTFGVTGDLTHNPGDKATTLPVFAFTAEFGFSLPPDRPFSLVFLMKIAGTPASSRTLIQQTEAGDYFNLYWDTLDRLQIRKGTTGWWIDTGISDDTYFSYVITRLADRTWKVYRNGTLVETETGTDYSTGWDIPIGLFTMESAGDATLTVDELAFWAEYVLDQTDVDQLQAAVDQPVYSDQTDTDPAVLYPELGLALR
jgi:hypothetical protein